MEQWQADWAYQKYWVMARSQHLYNAWRRLARNNQWDDDKAVIANELRLAAGEMQPTVKTLRNTYQHVWGYFKRSATPAEKAEFQAALADLTPEVDRVGPLLLRLAHQYRVDYLLQSRLLQEWEDDDHASLA
ncbi:YbgA family protein [Fructilactobacillus cliffordii]|uniref:YbgA family protein n=1 Tax=Fructilactobacillus cliffordii TaxID=2940299 RepID=UPI002093C7C4|nr:YbgA family protein [Fructilactobacillus cliffordii]USS85978.1 YbgA family protein [Fructilactobacillus cliffordii]